MQKKRYVIGLMSGTSLDGMDAAIVEISEEDKLEINLVDFISQPYTKTEKERLLELVNEKTGRVNQVCRLNVRLAEKFAELVFALLEKAGMEAAEVDLIGSHGQTIYHEVNDRAHPASLQIGSGAIIAERTGITTVANFRMRDIAAGGEGAPLVPYVDYLIYSQPDKNRVLQNIGGIGNFTYLPAGGELADTRGSDSGPGNMLIDAVVEKITSGKKSFDEDGKMAAAGQINQELLAELKEHPFFELPFPKSTGREVFGKEYLAQIMQLANKYNLEKNDLVKTVTALTAWSIIDSYQRAINGPIDEIIIGGGGSYNLELVKLIKDYCQANLSEQITVLTQEEIGFSSEAKEAVAFAVLAYQTMQGRANNVPGATGASYPVVLGDIIPGQDFYQYLNW